MANFRQSKNYQHYMQDLGWQVATISGVNLFFRHPPHLPFMTVAKLQRPDPKKINWRLVDEFCKKNGALLLILESDLGANREAFFCQHGFISYRSPLLYTATIFVDLLKGKDAILAKMSQEGRAKIRKAEKQSLKLSQFNSQDPNFPQALETFIASWHEFSKRKKLGMDFRSYMRSYAKNFKNKVNIFFLYQNSVSDLSKASPLWGLFTLTFSTTAHYLYAFTTPEGRKESASYLGLWRALEVLKSTGANRLDFEGIYDLRLPRYHPEWRGFTQFKRDWNTEVVDYPLPLVKYYNPLVGLLFKIFDR